MGNRAIITVSPDRSGNAVGIYVHWEGRLESVLAFITAAKLRGYCDPVAEPDHAMARLCAMICEYTGTTKATGVGIGLLRDIDYMHCDHGVYVIGHEWTIVDRWGASDCVDRSLSCLDDYGVEKYNSILSRLTTGSE